MMSVLKCRCGHPRDYHIIDPRNPRELPGRCLVSSGHRLCQCRQFTPDESAIDAEEPQQVNKPVPRPAPPTSAESVIHKMQECVDQLIADIKALEEKCGIPEADRFWWDPDVWEIGKRWLRENG